MRKILICFVFGSLMLNVLVSCRNQPNGPTEEEIKEKIIGKWKTNSVDGVPELTDYKIVRTYMEDGTSQASATRYGEWNAKTDEVYMVESNVIFVKKRNSDQMVELTVKDISDYSITISKFRYTGHPEFDNNKNEVYDKINVDYSYDIIGLWEGVSIEGDSTFGGADHRWKFFPGGAYDYYSYQDTAWVISDNTYNEYNVDGNWLAFRWQLGLDEPMNYEWWDILRCDDTMVWSGLREKGGKRFTTILTMKRVEGEY